MTTTCWVQETSKGCNNSEDRTFTTCSISTLFIGGIYVVGECAGLVRNDVENNGFLTDSY